MVRPTPQTQNTIQINASVQETGGPTGGARLTQKVADAALQNRDAYQNRAIENAYLQGQVVLNENLTRIEGQHRNSPDSMANAMQEYAEAFLGQIPDQNAHSKFQLQINKASQSAIARATAGKQAIIDDQSRFDVYQSLDLMQTELSNAAMGLFDQNPATALASSEQMQEITARATNALNSAGADGVPLVPAQQRASMMLSMRDKAYNASIGQWFDQQENKLEAAEQWLAGDVTIQMPDENGGLTSINMRDTLPESSRIKIDNKVMGLMRDSIAVKNQRLAMQDRADQEAANALYLDHQVRLQNGVVGGEIEPLTLPELDAQRGIYISGGRQNEYLALRNTMIEGTPVAIDGTIRNQMYQMAQSGIDPTEYGTTMVRDRRVDWGTLQEAQRIFQARSGPASDTQNFYTNQLVRALGGENQALDIAAQETISRAVIEMQNQFRQLQQSNELDDNAARDVFNRVLQNNSNLTLEDRVIARTPQFISKAQVGQRATPEMVEQFSDKILTHFAGKYETIEQLEDDPDYSAALEWLEDYRRQIRLNDAIRID